MDCWFGLREGVGDEVLAREWTGEWRARDSDRVSWLLLRVRVLSDLEGEEDGEEEEELVLPVRLGGVCWSVLSVFCPSLPLDRSVALLPLFLSLAL